MKALETGACVSGRLEDISGISEFHTLWDGGLIFISASEVNDSKSLLVQPFLRESITFADYFSPHVTGPSGQPEGRRLLW